ncbi:hypothetical protein F8388_011503 [Cannabis sativa]|uniref:Uncharacterized protein n=1 Tax=Cannabis sativa TaxID=3483 RepID=A0A7J6G6N4_CANSA|nr:hypothetical protein F8388_011503 [Cannabis sativa]
MTYWVIETNSSRGVILFSVVFSCCDRHKIAVDLRLLSFFTKKKKYRYLKFWVLLLVQHRVEYIGDEALHSSESLFLCP